MSNHVNRFYTAVSVLAGHGHIKQRLIQAYEDSLAIIEDDEMPVALRQSFADLRLMMNQVDPLNGEGPICASVRKMSVEDADLRIRESQRPYEAIEQRLTQIEQKLTSRK